MDITNDSTIVQYMTNIPHWLTPHFVVSYNNNTEQVFCKDLRTVATVLMNLSVFDCITNTDKNFRRPLHATIFNTEKMLDLTVTPFAPMNYRGQFDHLDMVMRACGEAYDQHLEQHSGWSVCWSWRHLSPEYHIELHF